MKINCAHDSLVDLTDLVPNPKNPNKHSDDQIKRLAEIIDYQGQRSPIVVSNRSGFITKGHGRLESIKLLGWEKVAVDYQDYDDEAQEYADIVADNAIAEWAVLDLGDINKNIIEFGPELDINLLGIKDFVLEPAEKYDEEKQDDIPEVKGDPVTKRGDIWLLGDHRVMCGDSTMIDDVEKLMHGQKADITFTSPPYNAGKTPKENGKYHNDTDNKTDSDYLDFLNSFTLNCLIVSDFVFSNIQSISGNKVALIGHLYKMQDNYADTIIWDKGSAQPAMARKVLNSQFEYIHIFSNKATRAIGQRDFRGTIPNIFTMNSKKDKYFAKIHKATFLVALPEMFIKNFTEKSCLDPFLGTGTTLIACEKTNRKCYGMELDEHYCDVIINRWQEFTGKKATLESTGEAYDSLKPDSTGCQNATK